MKSFGKMKNLAKKIGLSWITIWLVVAIMMFLTVAGYAAYTGVTKVKRVVSTKAGSGFLFSSNYMERSALVTIEYDEYDAYGADANPIYTAYVCNYAQGDRSTWFTATNIDYKLTARILLNSKYTAQEATEAGNPALEGTYKTPSAGQLNGKKFGIRKGNSGEFAYFSGSVTTLELPTAGHYSLSKDSISSDSYDILFDKSELQKNSPEFWIQLIATPKNEIGGEVAEISGYVGTCKRASGAANWVGEINDKDYASIDYDAYNYVITGNGSGTFYFAWDDDKVRPNEFALLNYGGDSGALTVSTLTDFSGYVQYGTEAPTGEDTWKCISISVDSEDLARYEFQLYKTNGDNYGSEVIRYVDYKFVAD